MKKEYIPALVIVLALLAVPVGNIYVLVSTPSLLPIERAMVSTVKVEMPDGGHGSGVVISAKGLILTNAHVCGEHETLTIQRSDGQQVAATPLWTSPREYDLCLLRTSDVVSSEFHNVNVNLIWEPMVIRAEPVTYGEEIFALGSPLGIDWMVVHGIVSNPNPDFAERFVFDANTAPGSSGGPIVDSEGRLVGLVSSGLGVQIFGTTIMAGFNFAIPAETIRMLLAQ